jgi:hypothetical protein
MIRHEDIEGRLELTRSEPPNVSADEHFAASRAVLEKALEETRLWLRTRHPSAVTYPYVAATQALPALTRMYEWKQRGATGQLPAHLGEVRACMYAVTRVPKQIIAYRSSNARAIEELISAIIPDLSRGRLLISLTLLRALIERAAALNVVAGGLSPLYSSNPGDQPAYFLNSFGEGITKALYSTRLNWQNLSTTELENVDPKAVPYRADAERQIDITAKNILNQIDKLNKKIPGIRTTYDTLCEFAHPNVGDLFATSMGFQRTVDWLGVVHYKRIIGVGEIRFGEHIDLARTLSGCCRICSKLGEVIVAAHRSLEKSERKARSITRGMVRQMIRNWPMLFRKGDDCLCGSERTLDKCCGRNVELLER